MFGLKAIDELNDVVLVEFQALEPSQHGNLDTHSKFDMISFLQSVNVLTSKVFIMLRLKLSVQIINISS